MSSVDGICEYVLDPDDPESWGGEAGDECYIGENILNEGGVWSCSHDVEEGEDLCIFHLPVDKKDEGEVIDTFLNMLEEASKSDDTAIQDRKLQFLGAKFGRFDLSGIKIAGADNDSINLSYSQFKREVDLKGTTIESRINVTGAQFEKRADFTDATFNSPESLIASMSEGKNNSEDDIPEFVDTNSGDSTGLTDYWELHEQFNLADFNFKETKFNEEVYFTRTNFYGTICFINVVFESMADFQATTFDDKISFRNTTFSETPKSVSFWSARFNSNADFRRVEFQGLTRFRGTNFNKEAIFRGARFRGAADFQSDFEMSCNFEEAIFEDQANFRHVKFGGIARFRNATIPHADYTDAELNEAVFTEADLTEGNLTSVDLRGATLETAILSRATLFDADLRGAKLSGVVLSDVRIDGDTKFLGNPSDENDTSPHTFSAIRSSPRCIYDPDYDEDDQYTDVNKAKSVYRALEELGGRAARPRLQTRCFVRRQDLNRKEYYYEALEGNTFEESLIAGVRWLRAKTSESVMKYGESPWRIIGTSAVIMIVFGVLYSIVGGITVTTKPATHVFDLPQLVSVSVPPPVEKLLMNLYFSVVTFTTLGYGDIQPSNGATQALAGLESLLGAALIALLVFVLGRRAAR
jgi:uncharacterized protein YjbI with pentapeptide repeats